MRPTCLSTIGLIVLCATQTAHGVDLAKIDRVTAKEPAYQSKTPKYCLMVFGPEAKTRVWLVLDGEVLYVDRNGNGDLTGADKRVEKSRNDGKFRVGSITAADGKTQYFDIKLLLFGKAGFRILLKAKLGRVYQYITDEDELRFADRPQDPPSCTSMGP
jgi:hypothetical protein